MFDLGNECLQLGPFVKSKVVCRVPVLGNLSRRTPLAKGIGGDTEHFGGFFDPKEFVILGFHVESLPMSLWGDGIWPSPLLSEVTNSYINWQATTHLRSRRFTSHTVRQDIPGVRRSTWAAYHAVTEWVDHYRTTRNRNPEERANRRLQSQWFGSGAQLKAKAWDLALQMTTAG